ncbi:O-methyltransferase [Streptomyces yunnanensis]|uniref:Caffeoyl-CoA O-methyltransferase n=1 Tax=Streptomyces yunnanensis TaxID=156453 RepID=A0A9X8QQL4_9ACTN|nr:O-methyltransferase [Streptomyces yunnanensis]SHL35783.1 caffeoyl-CoA O-methyltransferase [Streptomyces yunnanensis]
MTETPYDELKTVPLTREVYDYLLGQAEPPTPVQRWLAAQTHALGSLARMRVPHEQATLLTLLARLVNARRIVEVGTFTGYSTLALATGLAPGGTVLTCDTSEEWTSIARAAWREADVEDRIDLRLGPALETVTALPTRSDIDLVFLDADKPHYRHYWDLLVPRLRPGGLLIADNVLWKGQVHLPDATGNARALHEFNAHVRADPRVESVMLPVADGLTIARKRSDT